MEFIGVGAAAFWIALAAVLIAASFNKVRREQVKQDTLLRLIEKTGQLDEAQVKLLFPAPPPGPCGGLPRGRGGPRRRTPWPGDARCESAG
jgi:hypothetical protein